MANGSHPIQPLGQQPIRERVARGSTHRRLMCNIGKDIRVNNGKEKQKCRCNKLLATIIKIKNMLIFNF